MRIGRWRLWFLERQPGKGSELKLKPGLGGGVESALGVVVEVVAPETAGEDIREGGWVALWGGVWRGEQGEFVCV